MSSSLSIVVVNWNQTRATRSCLRRLRSWSVLEPELWLVDNASTDADVTTLGDEFAKLEIIHSGRNLGWGGAINSALRRLTSRYVGFINNDASIEESQFRLLVDTLDENPELAAVAPLLEHSSGNGVTLSAGGKDISRHIRTHLLAHELATNDLAAERPFQVAYLPGTVVLWRTAALRKLGLLEESYFFGGEMADICDLAAERGFQTAIVPAARARHDIGQSSDLRSRLYPYYILRNRFLFVRRRRPEKRLALSLRWACYGAVTACRSLLVGRVADARLRFLAVVDGLGGTFGDQNQRICPQCNDHRPTSQ